LNSYKKVGPAENDFRRIPSGVEKVFTFLSRAVRNPLQSIWGALFVIQRRIDPRDKTLAQAVRILREEIGQLQELVHDTLEFLRPEEEKRLVPVDLNILLTSLLAALTFNQKGADLSVSVSSSLDPALPRLPGEYEEIKRAFGHLLKSSHAALSVKGGILTVETHFSPDPVPGNISVVLTVEGPEVRGKYFDPGFPSFTSYPSRGNSLGAAIAQRIIQEHYQGDLKWERVAEGVLRLRVSLPLKMSSRPMIGGGQPAENDRPRFDYPRTPQAGTLRTSF
jgi:nitrogen-specific signal transduction histidine kinase